MATLYLLLLVASCLSIHAFPPEPLSYRLKNTIFADEKLEGGIFEHVDEFNDITLYSRSANNPYRLPTTTRPINYNLLWTVEFPRSVFAGDVKIQLHATTENVNEIVLHSQDLNIRSLTLLENDVEVPIENYVLQPEYHFLRVRVLNGVLKYDPTNSVIYTLHITFDAELRTDMTGLYVSWFRNNPNDPESFMASTHMQATAARFAFPCYDEPGFKATFEVTIRRPTALKSWFCTKQVSTGPSTLTGYQEDVYAITPIMPTYLLAVIVADYERVAKYADDGSVLYEVVGREHAISTNQSYYAFDVGQKLLQEMSDYTDYDFYSIHPSLKMTQGSIPDFRAGAMENWGLLLYREAYLMYDEQDTNSHFKATIATILSHEIAHMWFGNLVTCDWWDAFWLNEGFARYFQYFLTDWVEDYMELTPRFIIEQVHAALLTDSANNPHPLTNPGIGDPVAIRAMFSTISYNKGAAVIRMTDHLLGSNAHRQGLRQYLIDRRFSTATPEHLFQSLQNAAEATGAISEYGPDFSVIDYYRSWSVQAGHPVLNVEVDHQSGLMTVYQRRFNINSGYSTAITNWIVPVTFATASNPDFDNTKPTHIISEAVSIINRTTVGDEWVIFNKQQTGYYRVNYDDYTWDLIVMALRGPQRTTIHESNRAQIINDVFQFARSGLMTYTRAFNIISFLENETDYTPWLAAITGFNWIRNRLIQTEYAADLDARIAEWTKTVMTSVGYIPQENEPFTTSYLRYQMAPFACNLKVDECLDSAWTQFRELIDEGKPVPVDNRNWVYCNGLRRGSVADFNVLWNRYLTYNLDTEKILLLQTLGCTPHESALNTFLDAIIQPNYIVRPQDYTTAFNSAVSGNEGNTQIVFRYIQNHLEDVMNAFIIPNQSTPATPLSYISSRLRTQEEVAQFQLWADNNRDTLGSFYQTVRAGASTASIAWAATVQADIQNYLQSGNQVLQTSTPAPVVSVSPTTVPAPVLVQPTTPSLPELPGSAHAAFLSTLVVALALAANFAV